MITKVNGAISKDCQSHQQNASTESSSEKHTHGQFLQLLIEILAYSASSSGEFNVSVTWDGEFVSYRCGLATGWGSSFSDRRYHERFGKEPPQWVFNVHPYVTRGLLDCAVDNGQHLPYSIREFEIGMGRSNSNAICITDLHDWATHYLTAGNLDLAASQTLRSLLGSHLPACLTSIESVSDKVSRDVIQSALHKLYQTPTPQDPVAKWARIQLGGWFRIKIDEAYNWSSNRLDIPIWLTDIHRSQGL